MHTSYKITLETGDNNPLKIDIAHRGMNRIGSIQKASYNRSKHHARLNVFVC